MNNTVQIAKATNRRIAKSSTTLTFGAILMVTIAHVALGLVANEFRIVSTVHAILVLLVGFGFILLDRTPNRLICVIAYITGAEVLWRMTSAGIFHEYGKYAVVLLLFLAIIKWRRIFRGLPFLYFLFLTPSIILTLFTVDPALAREEISANLSGPLAVAVAAMFFTRYKLERSNLITTMEWMAFPTISIASISLQKIISAESITFTASSNFLTSGGYGPNQVGAILGLGALAAWIIVFIHQKNNQRIFFALVFLWLMTQSVLTFSRGGVLNLVIAAVPLSLTFYKFLFKRLSTLLIVLIILFSVVLVIIPRLEVFTQGTLEERYADLSITNRNILMQADIDAFLEHPLAGIGPGMAKTYYEETLGIKSAAHTEYTRVLSEHGILGILSLIVLGIILLRSIQYNKSWAARGMVMAFAFWALAEMTHSAMRIEAVAFCIGIATCIFEIDDIRKKT